MGDGPAITDTDASAVGRGADRVHKCDPGRLYAFQQLPPVEERQNQSNRPTVRGGPVRSVGHPTQSLTTAHEHGIYPNRRFAMCLVTHPEGLPTVTRPGRVANTPYQKPYPSAGGVCSRLPNIDPPLRHRASPAQTTFSSISRRQSELQAANCTHTLPAR